MRISLQNEEYQLNFDWPSGILEKFPIFSIRRTYVFVELTSMDLTLLHIECMWETLCLINDYSNVCTCDHMLCTRIFFRLKISANWVFSCNVYF